jgi:hypothetical protein
VLRVAAVFENAHLDRGTERDGFALTRADDGHLNHENLLDRVGCEPLVRYTPEW